MAPRLRTAGWARSRSAVGEKSRLPEILLVVGSVAFLAGAAILSTSIAPMFTGHASAASFAGAVSPRIPAGESATVIAPPAPLALVIPSPRAARQTPAAGPIDGVSFEISVPALGYHAMVRQGVGASVLYLGPGHYPGTPWPGQPGNVGVAAHNEYWLSFSRLRVGDRVEIRTQHALYVYEITGSTVVSPTNRTVLAPTNDNRLTLTTCYPIWAGVFATQRLIFTAREIGGVA